MRHVQLMVTRTKNAFIVQNICLVVDELWMSIIVHTFVFFTVFSEMSNCVKKCFSFEEHC